MAIPGVFSPVSIGDMMLVDGGLVNNFPADVLREMGADIIIGVEVTSTKTVTKNDLKSLPQVFARLLVTSTSAKRVDNRSLCDVHIIPDISGFGMLSFTPAAIDTLVGRGYKAANAFHDQLLSIKHAVDSSAGHPVSKILHAPHAKNLKQEPVYIRSINIDNVSDTESRWLIRKGRLKDGKTYSQDDIEKVMKIYRGTGCFDEITYQIMESDAAHEDNSLSDAYDLNINVKPAKPHVFGVGMRYDTEEGAGILLSLGLNEKKFNGSKLNASVKLSYNPKINLTYTYSRSSLANFNLAVDYRNEHFRLLGENNKGLNMRYQQQKVSGYISQFHLRNFSTSVGLSYAYTTYDLSSVEGSILDTLVFTKNILLTPYVNMVYDNLDDDYFANRGFKARLTGRYHIDMGASENQFGNPGRYFDLAYSFQSYITPGNGRFSIIPQVYGRFISGLPMYFNLWNNIGGEIEGRHFEEQLPFIGFTSLSSINDNAGVLRLDLRYNFYGKHYLTATYNTLVYADLWSSYDDRSNLFPFKDHGLGLKYSYNSILGPISLTAHWVNSFGEQLWGAYFSFGYTF